ncbi:MAG TPA: hypothetical protein VMU34_04450 [Mycobacterium sp.]|nr:hypothetical protein [Mycobacterium sp.]
MAGHNFGTDIRHGFNARMLGQALRAPGLDTRYWCSFATVCTVDAETGKKNTADRMAIHNTSAGVAVDVELEPLGQPCTCEYSGVQAGEVTIFAPIRPGDRVLVECPDGDLTTPVITHILHSGSQRQPTGPDRKPIFDNNRLLIYAKSVPIDIRTAGGVKVLLDQDGNAIVMATSVKLGGENAEESLIKGNTRVTDETEHLTTMAAEFTTMAGTCNNPDYPLLAPLAPGFAALASAVAEFQALLQSHLSQVSRTL